MRSGAPCLLTRRPPHCSCPSPGILSRVPYCSIRTLSRSWCQGVARYQESTLPTSIPGISYDDIIQTRQTTPQLKFETAPVAPAKSTAAASRRRAGLPAVEELRIPLSLEALYAQRWLTKAGQCGCKKSRKFIRTRYLYVPFFRRFWRSGLCASIQSTGATAVDTNY